MLTPSAMLAKINSVYALIFLFAFALVLSGCTPAGPRALLQGKRELDAGNDAAAAEQFRLATSLLVTNANAWNYYGVALQRTGQPDEAARAYQMALKYDRDLVEVHFNLGSLWQEQNKFDAAAAEFTAYSLHRPNDVEGWRKLAYAQWKLGEFNSAERSYSSILALKKDDAEAYHGLGLTRLQRGKSREAAQFFAAALRSQPDFGPAILDYAIVSQQYLRDPKTALSYYRAWLALTPRAANWDEVNTLANALEQTLSGGTATAVVVNQPPPKSIAAPVPAPSLVVAKAPAAATNVSAPRPLVLVARPAATSAPLALKIAPTPSPKIITAPPPVPKLVPRMATVTPPAVVAVPPPEPVPEPKSSLWHKLFGSEKAASAPRPQYLEQGVTPLPSPEETASRARRAVEPPPLASIPRYHYLAPRPPAAGNRTAASGAFTRAQVYEQGEKWVDAEQWYQQAAEFDPAWFEAQFNTAVIAHRMRNYSPALARYEQALAVRPDSADARYNFALALKAAGYVLDAAEEFKKILAADSSEVRTQLALANLYAQTLHDPAKARPHYLKVLALDPQNPAASDIRFWLSSNPG